MQCCIKIIIVYCITISSAAYSMTGDRTHYYARAIRYIQEVQFLNDTLNEFNETTLDMSSESALQRSQRRYDVGVITWPLYIMSVGTTCATLGIACILAPLACGLFC